MDILKDLSQVTLFIGIAAFIVSCITEVIKKIFSVQPVLIVIIVSLVLCPLSLLGLSAYYGIVIEWFMVFAAFIAAFVVALIAMDGWERVSELAGKLIKK